MAGDLLVFSGFCCGFQCHSVVGRPRETEEVITRNQCVLMSGRNMLFPRFMLYKGNCLKRLAKK